MSYAPSRNRCSTSASPPITSPCSPAWPWWPRPDGSRSSAGPRRDHPRPGDGRSGMTPVDHEEERRRARDEARRWVRRKRILFTMLGVYAALSVMWLLIDLADDSSGYRFFLPMLGARSG